MCLFAICISVLEKYLFKCADTFKTIFFNFFFFLRERDRDRESLNGGRAERERETQNPKHAPGSELSAQSPTWARTQEAQGHDLSWNQESDA